jgi:hypothetical protein
MTNPSCSWASDVDRGTAHTQSFSSPWWTCALIGQAAAAWSAVRTGRQ